jgi:predicted acetyltransferase
MATPAPKDAGNITLERASARAVPTLRRLMQLYLYDLGTMDGWDIGRDGRFGNARGIERFWTERGRRAFFIRVGPVLAGFALVRNRATFAGAGIHEISEFFVLRKYRRRGVGRQAATRLFDMFAGPWEVAELASNVAGQAFWRDVIAGYTGGEFEDRGTRPRRVARSRATLPGPGQRTALRWPTARSI